MLHVFMYVDRKPPSSRASSTTSYRSLASSRSTRSNAATTHTLSLEDDADQDVCFTDVASSARTSARSILPDTGPTEKKTLSPSDIVCP